MEKSYVNVDPDRNRYRFYNMIIQRNLFNQYYLVRPQCRIGRRGQVRVETYLTYEESMREFNRIANIRISHGYIDRGLIS
jgi:predicted DNA-binding WGR domain protein